MLSTRLFLLAAVAWIGAGAFNSGRDVGVATLSRRLKAASDVLNRVPLIDGHNDFPLSLRNIAKNKVAGLDIDDLTQTDQWSTSATSHTDINRLRQGQVGAQFWSAYVGCNTQHKDAVIKTLEQIDVVHRMVAANPDDFALVTTAQEVVQAFTEGKIGSLIGVEGGHSIGNSLAVLRLMFDKGVRYLTLTHSCTTPWADNSQLDDTNEPVHDGLSAFGELVVMEMNRLGMLVDLSHVSAATMRDALRVSRSSVIFSHSSAKALCNHTRNVDDDILAMMPANGGVVMVNFYSRYITCGPTATLADVADHIDHIKNVAGVNHVGIGGDYNGVSELPEGLEDVSKYPSLFAELLLRGWTENELEKLAGVNLLRVLLNNESVSRQMAAEGITPYDDWIPEEDLVGSDGCITPGRKSGDQPE